MSDAARRMMVGSHSTNPYIPKLQKKYWMHNRITLG
jgi:hypothetical protein